MKSSLSIYMENLIGLYGGLETFDLLSALILDEFAGRIALVSSFGAESAVLLHMVSQIDRGTDVIFLDTGKLFGETQRYRDSLVERFGLRQVLAVKPAKQSIKDLDSKGDLWRHDPNMCCHVRKTLPLQGVLGGFSAWITGRKSFHENLRKSIQIFERDNDASRIKVNPLAQWTRANVQDYFLLHDIPPHPLEADGYLSIGCMPCTSPVREGDGFRGGRWRGLSKTECGIHLPSSNELASRHRVSYTN